MGIRVAVLYGVTNFIDFIAHRQIIERLGTNSESGKVAGQGKLGLGSTYITVNSNSGMLT